MMHHFCTYFDHHFLGKGLALYHSLRETQGPFRLWVLCLSEECFRLLTGLVLPGVVPVSLSELEHADPELLAVKPSRGPVEYYFTLSPAWPLYILGRDPTIDMITYLDADLFFFSSADVLIAGMADHSVSIIPHRYQPLKEAYLRNGTYNVGWLSFKRDDNGLAVLNWWREKCLAWCYDRYEDGRYADQKYLDEWPARFEGVWVIPNPGANVAPWNIAGHQVTESSEGILVDGQPLIFYHFHGFRKVGTFHYDTMLHHYGAQPTATILHGIYDPYIEAVSAHADSQEESLRGTGSGIVSRLRQRVRYVRRICHRLAGHYYRYVPVCET